VEWPQRGAGVLPAADLTVHLDHAGAELRRVALSALSPRGERILARLPPFLEAG
jgi:tRNA threonylcarbamoyladenosine biosynthesis protein TsaE